MRIILRMRSIGFKLRVVFGHCRKDAGSLKGLGMQKNGNPNFSLGRLRQTIFSISYIATFMCYFELLQFSQWCKSGSYLWGSFEYWKQIDRYARLTTNPQFNPGLAEFFLPMGSQEVTSEKIWQAEPGDLGQTFKSTDKQTDGRYQIHYLHAMQSMKMIFKTLIYVQWV